MADWLTKLLVKPSREQIEADDGKRYRTNGKVTAFGVFLFFWDKWTERYEDPNFKPNFLERCMDRFEAWLVRCLG
jgi:hypothetical protein